MQELNFDLKLASLKVNITDKEGNKKVYILREMTGAQRDEFLDVISTRVNFQDGKPQSLSNFKGIQAILLSLCLYDEKEQKVSVEALQEFPANVLSQLFQSAQKLSGLTEEGAEEIKND